MIPAKLFLTNGVGRNTKKLASFEDALRDAKIEKYNLVRVSSILPPGCEIITREKGLLYLNDGEIVYCVMAQIETNENSRQIAASIGVAIPADKERYGYLSEHHAFGETDEVAGDYAEDLAASMLATTLKIPFDPSSDWKEKEKSYLMSGKIVKSRNITQSAESQRDLWTTVIAAAVFIPPENLERKLLNQ